MRTKVVSVMSFFCLVAAGFCGQGQESIRQRTGRTSRIQSAVGDEVGRAARDGISVAGGDAVVTRNGVSYTLERELRLANGIVISPDGTVTRPDGSSFILKSDQRLTFDGEIIRPSQPAPKYPANSLPGTVSQPSGSSG